MAIVGDIYFSSFKPFDGWFSEIPIHDLVPFLVPMKIGCNICPKMFGLLPHFSSMLLCILRGI